MSNGGVLGRRNVPGVDGVSGVWSLQEIANARRAGVWPPDPYWANVVALLHADGSDGSMTFIDERGHTFTAVGNAQIDTAQSTFGGASALHDGAGDYVWAADSPDWDFGTGDFTIQISARFAALPSSNAVTLVTNYQSGGAAGWGIQYRNDGSNRLRFFTSGDTGSFDFAWTPSLNTWYRIGVKRVGTSLSAWVNEAQIGTTQTSSANIAGSTGQLWIGALNFGGGIQFLNGWWDELRITKGVGRDLSAAPIGPFPNL